MTPQQLAAMKMALDLATMHHTDDGYAALRAKVRSASKEALAQPEQEPLFKKIIDQHPGLAEELKALDEQEPVAWYDKHGMVTHDPFEGVTPLYTTPPQRKPLSNQKIIEMYNEPRSDAEMIEFARAIEAAHGIWPENSDCYGPDWTDRDGEYLK